MRARGRRLRSVSFASVALVIGAAGVRAQTPTYAPPARQIAAAVSPLPLPLRANATVFGYDASGKFVTLRRGSNDMVCLADDPSQKMYHVACYHRALEPFMSRGRELHARRLSRP